MSKLANDTNPYAPAEDSATIYAERTVLRGAIFSAVIYGAESILFCMCFYLILRQRSAHQNYRKSVPLLIYVCILFILGTIYMGCDANRIELSFIDNRNFPGGPYAYASLMNMLPVSEMGSCVAVIQIWLCDAILAWRCMVVFKGSRVPLWAIALFPCLIFLGTIALSIVWLLQVFKSGPFEKSSVNWTIPYFTLSLSLNILTTIAIISRLLVYRWRITRILASSHASQYTSIAAMIVESAAIYSAFSVFLLLTFALNSPLSTIPLQSLNQVQSCATLLIIFRVAQGRAWDDRAQHTLSEMLAARNTGVDSESCQAETPSADLPNAARTRMNQSSVTFLDGAEATTDGSLKPSSFSGMLSNSAMHDYGSDHVSGLVVEKDTHGV